MKTPDETVAEKITNALLEKGLINGDDAKSLGVKLMRGEIKDGDWSTLLRMGMQSQKKAEEGEGGQ